MPTGNKYHNWMVHNLEQPFLKAELHRAEILRNKNGNKSGKPGLILISLMTLVPLILLITGSL